MKISPNREQLMLVIIMNGLIVFIVAVLSIELLVFSAHKSNPYAASDPTSSNPYTKEKVIIIKPAALNAPEAANLEEITQAAANPSVNDPAPTPDDQAQDQPKIIPPRPAPHMVTPTEAVKPATETTESKPEKSAPVTSGYSVQLAAFSDKAKAAALVDKLATLSVQGKPLTGVIQNVTIGKKTLYRVRMGPFDNQALAKQAASVVNKETSLKGTVLRPGM